MVGDIPPPSCSLGLEFDDDIGSCVAHPGLLLFMPPPAKRGDAVADWSEVVLRHTALAVAGPAYCEGVSHCIRQTLRQTIRLQCSGV